MVHNTTLNNYYSIVHAIFNILITAIKSYNKIIILLGYNYTSMHACQLITFWHCTICSNALMQLHYTITISSYNYYKPGVYTYQLYKRFLSNSEFKYVALGFTTAIFLEFHSTKWWVNTDILPFRKGISADIDQHRRLLMIAFLFGESLAELQLQFLLS